jgi:hypothetical protein
MKVEVVKIEGNVIWYRSDELIGLHPCQKEVFEKWLQDSSK